jgi:hypothetical protein
VLVCARCATSHDASERFCPRCGLPLTLADTSEPPLTDRRERARKVLPQYGEGELVKVGWARNQPEAELLAGMLLEEGIPSVVRRNGGFDVPDFLAAGPRDILVAASGADAARDVLGTRAPAPAARSRPPAPRWARGVAYLLVAVIVALVAAGLIAALGR